MNTFLKRLLQVFLPALVILAAIFMARTLIKMRKKPAREAPQVMSVPVRTMEVALGSAPLTIEAAGTVLPSRQVELRPQVSGQIVEMSENLQPGGVFKEGDVILRIDPRDYQFALEKQKAQLEQAEFEVTQEKGRGAIAEREWGLLGEDMSSTPEGKELALRKPHLKRALAALEAAKIGLEEAKLDLERTTITAPFNVLVKKESVDPGQLVTTQTVLATLSGTDSYWVQASLPVSDIDLFQLPHPTGEPGAFARIIHKTGSSVIEKQGRVVRLLGDLEEAGRMARVLIEIQDPLGLKQASNQAPLLLGAFVHVEIQGDTLENVFAVPATALREGDRLWLKTEEDTLEIRTVNVLRRQQNKVFIDKGLHPGDKIVVSRIGTPVPGMGLNEIDAREPIETAAKEGSGE